MRVLGLDLGEKRIGLAVSDDEGRIAFPAGFLERKGRRRDFAALRTLVRERGIESAVVGWPLHMSGRRGPEAEAAERFARELSLALEIPVELLDERWTSVAAERALQETGRRVKQRKGRGEVDAIAATLLLATHLDRCRNADARGQANS
jgi:putative Holliday junction resolvase